VPSKQINPAEVIDLDTDDLRAELDRRDTRAANLAAAERAAATVAELGEARRRYREAIPQAENAFQAEWIKLASLVAKRAGIAELHAQYLKTKLADAVRHAISRRVCADMNALDPLPPNPTAAAPQSRAITQREWRGTDFHGFLLSIEERWAEEDMAALDARMREEMDAVVDKASSDALKAAEAIDDGYLQVEQPELFGDKYQAALAELDHEPTTTERQAAQQKLLLEEAGGRRPTTT
jgi:hypothetical protein